MRRKLTLRSRTMIGKINQFKKLYITSCPKSPLDITILKITTKKNETANETKLLQRDALTENLI